MPLKFNVFTGTFDYVNTSSSGGGGVGSINGDSTNAQTIAAGTGILVADNGTGTHTVKAINTIQTYTPSSGGTATLNLSLSNVHHITMPASGNITIALSNGTVGQCFIVRILQGAAGSQTVTFFTTIKWAGGSQPTLTTTSGKADTVGFEITGSSTYDGFVVGANI